MFFCVSDEEMDFLTLPFHKFSIGLFQNNTYIFSTETFESLACFIKYILALSWKFDYRTIMNYGTRNRNKK